MVRDVRASKENKASMRPDALALHRFAFNSSFLVEESNISKTVSSLWRPCILKACYIDITVPTHDLKDGTIVLRLHNAQLPTRPPLNNSSTLTRSLLLPTPDQELVKANAHPDEEIDKDTAHPDPRAC